jgi:hypothetical protein
MDLEAFLKSYHIQVSIGVWNSGLIQSFNLALDIV